MATTFGKSEGLKAFQKVPLSSAAAKANGWTLLSSCEGKFPGIRYTDPSEPSLVAIYDLNDIIAGLQAVILEKDLNFAARENFGVGGYERKQNVSIYTKDLWIGGEPAFFSTVVFTDPKAICDDKVKRTLEGGFGDRLLINYNINGYFHEVPITKERAQEIDTTIWGTWDPSEFSFDPFPVMDLPDGFPPIRIAPSWESAIHNKRVVLGIKECVPGMGSHLMDWSDFISPCRLLPLQGLYDKGDLIGFAWTRLG